MDSLVDGFGVEEQSHLVPRPRGDGSGAVRVVASFVLLTFRTKADGISRETSLKSEVAQISERRISCLCKWTQQTAVATYALYRVVVYTSPISRIMEETDKIVLTTIKAA